MSVTRFLSSAGRAAAFAVATCLASLPAHAQQSAAEASGTLGEPQTIDVDVGADTDVASIALHHRFSGGGFPAGGEFARSPMEPVGTAPGLYSATVPTAGVQASALEFYVVAEDTLGESLFKGSAFAPIVRELRPGNAPAPLPDAVEEPIASAPAPEPAADSGDGRRYLWYALGAIAVGAAIAAAADGGGDGGDGDSSGCDAGRCDLTLSLPEP